MPAHALRVLWISDFPIEWLPEAPAEIRALPRQHPLTWLRVLQGELAGDPQIELHIAVLRKNVPRDISFSLPGGATVHVLKVMGGLRAPTLFCTDTIRLRSLARRLQPDLVHAWGTERGAAVVAKRLPYPYLVSVQGLMSWVTEFGPVSVHERLAALLEKWSLPKALLATVESSAAVEQVRRRYPRLNVRRIEYAPAPLFFELPRRPRQDPPRLLYLGGLFSRKGADTLLAALEQLAPRKSFTLTLGGFVDGPLASEWTRLAQGPLAGRLDEKISLTPPQVAAELAEATMLICPTRVDTGPTVVKEATVAGVPVVGTRVGGIPEYVTDGANGVLVAPGDVASLVAGIEQALEHPLLGRGEVEAGALARTRALLSPTLMKEAFCQAYRDLANRLAPR